MGQTDIREIAVLSSEEGKTQIEERIFNIRGKQVMIDKDLAQLYGVETKRLNEQVKRNIERFPEDFMFQLTLEECEADPKGQPLTLIKSYSSAFAPAT